MSVNPIPEGYPTVTPYLLVQEADALIAFLEASLDGEVTEYLEGPDDTVSHAEVRIGESLIMMGEPEDEAQVHPVNLHVYVEDVDATYERALAAGGESLSEPEDKFYGDRSGAVRGPQGNVWWISTHVEDVSPEEIRRRAAADR